MAPIFGDLRQSEKLSELKPPFVQLCIDIELAYLLFLVYIADQYEEGGGEVRSLRNDILCM